VGAVKVWIGGGVGESLIHLSLDRSDYLESVRFQEGVKQRRVGTHPEGPFLFPIRFRYGFRIFAFPKVKIMEATSNFSLQKKPTICCPVHLNMTQLIVVSCEPADINLLPTFTKYFIR
jgi:hypothetical protein